MRKIEEIGVCPSCDCSICIFKTNSHKRFAKCICGLSYALPKAGSISYSALDCPNSKYPILIVEKNKQKAYFWADKPCFTCSSFDSCEPVNDLTEEFKELEVYGY